MILRLLALTVLVASSATAQEREAPTAVSPVTVMPATLPPRVVATYPGEGQTIAPGVLVLTVAFDQRMNPRTWRYGAAPDARQPECVETPRLLNDHRTFVLLCRVLSGRTYQVALNAEPAGEAPPRDAPPHDAASGGFANLADNPARPHVLTFQVVAGEPVTSISRALKAAGLKPEDEPIAEAPKPAVRPTP